MRFHPNSPYSLPGKAIYVAFAILLALGFLFSVVVNLPAEPRDSLWYRADLHHYDEDDQYARLADSLLHGRVSLDLPVPDELKRLENPYDPLARYDIGSEDVPIYWDHAYRHGEYYSYFGVVPAVLVYLPYEVITGRWMPTPLATALIGILAIAAMSLLVRRFALRYFAGSTTTVSLCLCLLVLFAGSNAIALGFLSRFYSIPTLSAQCFTFMGLWFWLGAKRNGRRTEEDATSGPKPFISDTLSASHLFFGSLCMALTLGCRPQFILASFLAFAVFGLEIFKDRLLFSKRGIKSTILALAPFAVVFAPLLWYNYARFGSIFDFGSAYNLTGFDMTAYHQRYLFTFLLMAVYLFWPITPTGSFPFVEPMDPFFLNYGWAPNEPFFGGMFAMAPILLFAFAMPFLSRMFKAKQVWAFSILCIAFAFVVLFVDTRVAGLTERYICDFGFYFALVACLSLLALQEKLETDRRKERIVMGAAIFLAVFTLTIGALALFSPERYEAISTQNPELYSQVSGLFGQ